MSEERIQKILAHAGVASRRTAEQLMLEGRVTVNGAVVDHMGAKADLETDDIRLDGSRIRPAKKQTYILLYKPKMYVTTVRDPEQRRTVMDLLPKKLDRIYPVGRLDYHSEGLILMTNDGDLANKLLDKSNEIPKTYRVKATGRLTHEQLEQFRQGIPLEGRRTLPAEIKPIRRAENPWYEVTLVEGRTNQIRLMFKHFGRLVEKLKRVRIGPLSLRGLQSGQFRELLPSEIAALKRAARGPKRERRSATNSG